MRPASINLAAAIVQHFEQLFSTDYQDAAASFDEFAARHIFFMTLTFKQGTVSHLNQNELHPLKQTGRIFYTLSKTLLGHRLHQKRLQQPLAYAAIDFEGTRTGEGDIQYSQNPHVHALLLIRPEHIDEFHRLKSQITSKRWAPGCVDTVDLQQFDPDKGSLYDLATYITKGVQYAVDTQSNTSADTLWTIFPSQHRANKAAAKHARKQRRYQSQWNRPVPTPEQLLARMNRKKNSKLQTWNPGPTFTPEEIKKAQERLRMLNQLGRSRLIPRS